MPGTGAAYLVTGGNLTTVRFLLQMFWSFFKIGAFTFGGGYAMVPLIQKEVVDARGWVTGEEFIDMLSLAQTAPGPVAVNTSVFVGYRKASIPGAMAAVAGATLPSFVVILALATVFSQVRHLPATQAAFSGIRPAVVALVAGAAYKIGRTAIRDLRGVAIAALALVALAVLDVHPIPVIVGSGVVGYLLFRRDLGPRPEAPQELDSPQDPGRRDPECHDPGAGAPDPDSPEAGGPPVAGDRGEAVGWR